jgi:hypothetical protein
MGGVGISGKKILQQILEKMVFKVWVGFIWLRIEYIICFFVMAVKP